MEGLLAITLILASFHGLRLDLSLVSVWQHHFQSEETCWSNQRASSNLPKMFGLIHIAELNVLKLRADVGSYLNPSLAGIKQEVFNL